MWLCYSASCVCTWLGCVCNAAGPYPCMHKDGNCRAVMETGVVAQLVNLLKAEQPVEVRWKVHAYCTHKGLLK